MFHIAISLAKDAYFGELGQTLKWIFEFGGNSGVAFFFVLSGFIISRAHRHEAGDLSKIARYFRKRAYRIFPTYWIVFAIAYCASLILPPSSWVVPSDPATVVSAFFLLPLSDGSIKGFSSPILSVAWTLRFELLFYAFFGLFYFGRRIFHMSCIAILFLATHHLITQSQHGSAATAIASSHFMLLFLMGVGGAKLIDTGIGVTASRITFYAGLIAFALVALVYDLHSGEVDRAMSDLAFGLASVCIIVGAISLESAGQMSVRSQFLRDIGDASYAIYLIHYPLVALVCKLGVKVMPFNGFGVAATLIAALAASLVVGIGFHKCIEAPLLRRLNKLEHAHGSS